MSGSANKNPQGNQAVDKKTSSVTGETSIVKPTKENYYEVNTRNEKIIRDKYVLLEKTHTEVQSEIQTFNKNYKQLLELNQLHKQPYFLPSFRITNEDMGEIGRDSHHRDDLLSPSIVQNNRIILRCCGCNGQHRLMYAIQFNNDNTIESGNLKPIIKDAEEQSESGVEGREDIEWVGTRGSISPNVSSSSDHFSSDGTGPQYYNMQGRRSGALDRAKEFAIDTKDATKDMVGKAIVSAKENVSTAYAGKTSYTGMHKTFRCACKNHALVGCGQRDLIQLVDAKNKYEFNPINNSQVNMIFYCRECGEFFRYECLQKMNENSASTDHDYVGVIRNNTESLNIMSSLNRHMIFRKPLFKSQYGDNLEKVAAGLEAGVSFKKGGFPIKIHAGLGSIYSKMGALGLVGAVAGYTGVLPSIVSGVVSGAIGTAGSIITSGTAAGAAAGIGASLYSQRGGAQQLDELSRKVGHLGTTLDQPIVRLGFLTNRARENQTNAVVVGRGRVDQPNAVVLGRGRVDQPNAVVVGANNPESIDISGKSSTQASAFTSPQNKDKLTIGKRYKSLQLTETYEDFISELKKWKLSEMEDELIAEFSSKQYTGESKMGDDYKKYRPEYKNLQKLYISDFNQGISQLDGFPFRDKDFEYLRSLKNNYDDADDAYVGDTLRINGSSKQINRLTMEKSSYLEYEELLNSLDMRDKIDVNSDEMMYLFLRLLKVPLNEEIIEYHNLEQYRPYGEIYPIQREQLYRYKPSPAKIIPLLGRYLLWISSTSTPENYHNLRKITLEYVQLKDLKAKLKSKYDPMKEKIDNKINTPQSKNEEIKLTDVKYKKILEEMCGSKAANFWYGNDSMKIPEYRNVESLFMENRFLFFPFYDLKILKALHRHSQLKFTNTPADQGVDVSRGGSVKESYTIIFRADQQASDTTLNNLSSDGRFISFTIPSTSSSESQYIFDKFKGNIWMAKSRPYYPEDLKTFSAYTYEPPATIHINTSEIEWTTLAGQQKGGSSREVMLDIFTKLEELDTEKIEYMQEVLPLFDLLRPNQTKKQGSFEITQLTSQNNLLNNTSLNINGDNIWQEPKDKEGVNIISPIQLLKIKKELLDKARDFYNMESSINADLEFKKKYEKELSKDSKKISKEEKQKQEEQKKKEKEDRKLEIEAKKAEIESKKNELKNQKESGTIDNQQIIQEEKEIAREEKQIQEQENQIEEQEELDKKEQQLEQKEQQLEQKEKTTDLKQDKLYTKTDVSKASDELDKLKREMKRREDILKNIASNIKLLKSQRHGEDSEQRQLQQREYELKERELILFQKLVEQREEKLKVLKILTDKLSLKDKKERSEMMRRDEINKQQNFLALQNEMNSITVNKSREMSDSLSGIQNDEISELKNQLNSLEGGETHIQREIVQNGGAGPANRKDDLRGLLYKTKTESRRNRTKIKKNRNKRANERKKDRSLRKRI
jgi:hypothetical protein